MWADSEYRAQNLEWKRGFDEQLAYVNAVVGPMLGIRLVPEYRAWERHAPGAQLGEDLDALAAEDPGADAVFVVGLTSSLSLASATFDQIGVARLGDAHVMLRGHADLEEREHFERLFPKLDAGERAQLLEARKRHKVAAVLLHELSHSLGALHEVAEDNVMSPMYSEKAAHVDDHNRALMLIELDERLAAHDPRAAAAKRVAALEQGWDGWVADERTGELQNLRAYLAEAGGVPASAVVAPRTRFDARAAAATATIGPAPLERIQDATMAATARLAANDLLGARAALAAVEPSFASLSGAQASAAWLALAEAYSSIGALASAEAALAHAGPGDDDRGIAAWAAQSRIRYGIPRGARNIDATNDLAALAAVKRATALAEAAHVAEAAKALAAADAQWPALPGLAAARCDLELRRGALAAARRACAAAGERSSWALYLAGMLDLKSESRAATDAGVAHLRAAIALDPDLDQAWRALGRALARAHRTADLDALARDYEQRFRRPLTI